MSTSSSAASVTTTATPPRTPRGNESFTQVVLAESPASSPQKNITGYPRQVRDTAADIYNNIQHWNTLHVNGAGIVKEIALLKADSKILYPDGLEPLTISLMETIGGMSVIIENLEMYAKQLKTFIELYTSPDPMFITWPTEKMSQVAETIYNAYNQEYKLKKFIVENIPHISGKEKLMFYAASWAHQPYITEDINICLESFLTETGHRNKT